MLVVHNSKFLNIVILFSRNFSFDTAPLHEYVTLATAFFGAANSVKTLSNYFSLPCPLYLLNIQLTTSSSSVAIIRSPGET